MGKGSAAAFRLLRSQCSAPGRARDRTKPSETAAFAGGKSSTALFCLPVSSIAWREERGLWARGQGCCFASESWTSTLEGEQPGPGKELLKNTAQNQLKRRVPADQSLKYLSTESALTASSTLNCSIHWQWLWSSREQSQMRCWMGLILPHQWSPLWHLDAFALANKDTQGLVGPWSSPGFTGDALSFFLGFLTEWNVRLYHSCGFVDAQWNQKCWICLHRVRMKPNPSWKCQISHIIHKPTRWPACKHSSWQQPSGFNTPDSELTPRSNTDFSVRPCEVSLHLCVPSISTEEIPYLVPWTIWK